MFTRRNKKEVVAALLLSAAVAVDLLACSGASAMGKSQSVEDGSTNSVITNEVQSGSFNQGVQLGLRNGEIMANRLRDRTVNTEGCGAMAKLENALTKVTQTIRAPLGDDALVRGFFSGYTEALRKAIRESRMACGTSAFDDGGFAGSLFGTLLCRAVTVSLDATVGMELSPLFDGWSNGSDEVMSQCRVMATVTLNNCGQESLSSELKDILALLVIQSCSDTTTTLIGEE